MSKENLFLFLFIMELFKIGPTLEPNKTAPGAE